MKVLIGSAQVNIDESKAFDQGGEGYIVEIVKNTLAGKIYHNGKSSINELKIKELSVLPDDLFVKPKDIIYKDNKSIGYTMALLPKSKYIPLEVLTFRGCSDEVLTKLCKAIEIAHRNDIVIGDLSLNNIMIDENVNDVKFIDVDSYQTKSFKHSGVMFPEIMDMQRNCEVSKESDFFSLAICLFKLMTKVHPFKGIHKIYKNNINARMRNRLPLITGKEPDISAPRVFVPPSKGLIPQFEDIFKNDKRFIIALLGKREVILPVVKLASCGGNISSKVITNINQPKFITYSNNTLILNYENKCEIFKFVVKGRMELIKTINFKVNNSIMIPYDSNKSLLYLFDGKSFYSYDNDNDNYKKIFELDDNVINFSINGEIVNIVTSDYIYEVSLSNGYVKTNSVFGLSFKTSGSLLQNIVDINNPCNSFSIVDFKSIIKGIVDYSRTKNNYSIYSIVSNGVNEIFELKPIDGKLKSISTSFDSIPLFNYNFNMFTIPLDGKIKLLNKSGDEVMTIECDIVDTNTFTLFTPSGIVVIKDNVIHMLNMI